MQADEKSCSGTYDIYPSFPLGSGKIVSGYDQLAGRKAVQRHVVIDGYGGVLWDRFVEGLSVALARLGVRAAWLQVEDALLPEAQIDALIEPFLGGATAGR